MNFTAKLFVLSVLMLLGTLYINATTNPSIATGTLTGKIISDENAPLVGVNVIIKNTTIGAATDEHGFFTIKNIPVGNYDVIVSMVGYKSESVKVYIIKDQSAHFDLKLKQSFYEAGSVVVTGTVNPYLFEESPVKTEVVPAKLIERSKSINLADALGFQTGVRVENDCQNCNFTQVRILGFEGKYSQILIDGDPVVSTLAGVYALEQFPKEMIGQLEIVKGGGSALYGAGAVAGTINLRTQRPQLNRARVSYLANSLSGDMDHSGSAIAELISDDGIAGAYVFGSLRDRHQYDRNGDGYSELGKLSAKSFGINAFYKPFNTGEITLGIHRIYEDRRGGNDFDLPKHEADIAEALEHYRWGGKLKWEHTVNSQINYNMYVSFSTLKRDSYYGGLGDLDEDGEITDIDRQLAMNFYGEAKNNTYVTGLQGNYILGDNRITAGFDYSYDDLEDQSVHNDHYHLSNTYKNFGFYLQDDFNFGHHLNIIVGARLDKHSELEDPVISPRLNIKYEVSEGVDLRASYSTGFKAPVTFDEDLHIESLGGEQRVVRNIDNLKEEKSYSFSAGVEIEKYFGKIPVLVGVTGFHTTLTDAFAKVESNEIVDGLILWDRINSDGATLYSVEIDLGIKPLSNLEIRTGFTFKKNEYDSEQEVLDGKFSKKFMRTPDVFGNARVMYEATEALNFIGTLRYTGTMVVPNEQTGELVETDDTFIELDLGMSYAPIFLKNLGAKISLGIKNITDAYQEDLGVGVDRDPAYLYGPQFPRRIYAGIDFSW